MHVLCPVLLSCYGNVPLERALQVIGTLFGVPVSAGFVGKAAARVNAQPSVAGFDEAMLAALAGEDVLAGHAIRGRAFAAVATVAWPLGQAELACRL